MADPYLGRLLIKRYQLSELVGTGAMGRVYRAKDTLLGGVPVAVKFLSMSVENKKMRVKERFEREAKTCAILGQKSIHIVRVMDYGVEEENNTPFYVMEYLKGRGLGELIKPDPLPLPRFLSVARQICLGLQCAHEGIPVDGQLCPIIHRDIKPSNILVMQDSSLGELVKILDFGIAKLRQADTDQTTYYLGTLAYSSPEQMEGKELDTRSDIYSMGVMMFEMLTGKMPLQAETHSFGGWYKVHHFEKPRSFGSFGLGLKIPKALENLVMSCLAKAADDRPQSIKEVLDALEPLEQRFGTGRQIGQRIGEALSKVAIVPRTPASPAVQPETKPAPVAPPSNKVVPTERSPHKVAKKSAKKTSKGPKLPATANLSADEACQTASWPKNKPIAEIVFPQPLRTKDEVIATLWVMLKQKEIEHRWVSTRYNQFLCLMSPHPMVLWLTALYNREHGPRWLPCYLDLKTSQGQKMTRLLGESGRYRLLFFAVEDPKRCADVKASTIAPYQCKQLTDWANSAQTHPSAAQPKMSREILKRELEKIKPKIVLSLESLYSDPISDISGLR